LLVGLAVFLLALDGGAYAVGTRSALAIALWWAILLCALTGVALAGAWSRPALISAALLWAFALWSFASMTWAPSLEDAFAEGNRALIYLGVFLVAAFGTPLVRHASAGLATGIVGVAVIALISRLYPDVVDPGPLSETIVAAVARLSYPVGYWNGLAMLVALGVPLLLGLAVGSDRSLVRAVAVAPIPALVAVVYLASSRGGFLVATVGALVFLVLTERRWSALIALLTAAAGSAGAIAALTARPVLVDAPLDPAAADAAGPAALAIVASCLLAGAVHAAIRAIPVRRPPPPALGWGLVVAVVVAAFAVLLSTQPLERFEDFRRAEPGSPGTVQDHLLNVSSTGRWQQWGAAVDQFGSAPVRGVGAGSYGSWWLEHGTGRGFVTEAHSLYLETLGELGLVGGGLLMAAILLPLGAGVARSLRATGSERVLLASLTAAAAAYATGAGIDWMWELTVVSVVGFACLGLIAGRASARSREPGGRMSPALRACLVVTAVAAVALHANALLVDARLRQSERAAARADVGAAARDALAAADLAPWAATPRLQLALLSELSGDLPLAQRRLDEAIDRDDANWRLWLVAARLHVKRGETDAALAALATARTLNPRSPVLLPGE
jgi:hypothetical protein